MIGPIELSSMSDELGLIKLAISKKLIKKVTDPYVRRASNVPYAASVQQRLMISRSGGKAKTLDAAGVRKRTDTLRMLAGEKAKGSLKGGPKVPKGSRAAK